MQETSTIGREIIFEEISQRYATPGDAIAVLLRFLNDTAELSDVLYRMTEHDGYDSTTNILEDIEENLVKAERFLREESFAVLAQAKREWGEYFSFEAELPANFFMSSDVGRVQFEFPLWLFGRRKPKDVPPSFHKKRPYVREQLFWNALIRRMVESDPNYDVRREISLEAQLQIRFATRLKNAQDLDHYHVAPFVNSLVYNGLLFSDHAARLSYALTWEQMTPKDVESVHISILYGSCTP